MSIILKARYRRIVFFFAGIILNVLWWDLFLPRIGLKSQARDTRPRRMKAYASAYRRLAIQMGGVMIKIGQFLSARVDVLPPEVTAELAGLQDEVEPEPFDSLRPVIEADFGCRIEEKFTYIDPLPLAAASIGQVHRASIILQSAEEGEQPGMMAVVVKVQRPRIGYLVEIDLSALKVVSRWINLYRPIRRRADIPALLKEFSKILYEEIDYLAEGRNAEIFGANFADNPGIRVPKVYWSHTTRRVLTLEDVMAIKITDYPAIEASGVERGEIAERLIVTCLTQIFDHRFFHADPHPGNLFVFPEPGQPDSGKVEWKLVFVDFGMVGQISGGQYQGMRELLIGVITRDMKRVIKSYQLMGVLVPEADLDLIERAGMQMLERLWGKTVPEMMESMHGEGGRQLEQKFTELISDMPFQMPQNMVLIGRCLAILSGLCTGLQPEFNVFTRLEPYARTMLAEDGGSRFDMLWKELTRNFSSAAALPGRLLNLMERAEQGKLEVRTPGLETQMKAVNRSLRRLSLAVVFFALVYGSAQLYLGGALVPAGALAAGGILLLVIILFG